MPTLHLLGTGAAFTDAHRTTAMLAFTDGPHTLIVDCGGDVVQRLQAAGIDLDTIAALFVTHEHPDHVGGFPLFIEKIWLAGRRRPIPVYGIHAAIDQARRCFEVFDTHEWKGLPEIVWHEVAHEEGALVLDDDHWRITAAPGIHSVPVAGLRVESKATGRAVAYSCDTRPSEAIARLSRDADILVHEANGASPVHSSPEEAAGIARQAGARRLILIHVAPGLKDEDLAEARKTFAAIEVAEELGRYAF
jgi:ribonuclease Z